MHIQRIVKKELNVSLYFLLPKFYFHFESSYFCFIVFSLVITTWLYSLNKLLLFFHLNNFITFVFKRIFFHLNIYLLPQACVRFLHTFPLRAIVGGVLVILKRRLFVLFLISRTVATL